MASFSANILIGTSFLFMLVVLGVFSSNNAIIQHYITPGSFLGVIQNAYTTIIGVVLLAGGITIGLLNFPNPFLIFAGVFLALIPIGLGILSDIQGLISPSLNTFTVVFIFTIDGIMIIFGLLDWYGQKNRV